MPAPRIVPQHSSKTLLLLAALTLFAFLLHGWHPYAEDGGLYVAGIKKLLDPTLYGPHPSFVTGHLRFSLFAPLLAFLARATALPLPVILLSVYVVSLWATLAAAWLLIAQCTPAFHARAAAVTLLACWLTLPVAGTSLLLVDPYLTARSLSTPLVLLALAAALHAMRRPTTRTWLLCICALTAAAALHPLMAAYGALAALLLACTGRPAAAQRLTATLLLASLTLAAAALLQTHTPPDSPGYLRVALTRYYWFPAQWHWYELAGLAAPLLLIAWLGSRNHQTGSRFPQQARTLAHATLILGLLSLLLAIAFSRASLPAYPLARLQPLRAFQIVYALMILLLGAFLGKHILRRKPWRWATLLLLCAAPMLLAARRTYPASAHLELPWLPPINPWEQAFLWVRDHTPRNAVFALDAAYITQGKHEDAQSFRALAERNALPDYSKDGGEAAITPSLTAAWIDGQAAQSGLEYATDDAREAALKPLGATWAILETTSPTAWSCPYRNATVKVCQLP